MGAAITLIIGPGGCGKTHRLDALADVHDGPVVRVQGSDLEQATEFGALRGLLDHVPATHHEAAQLLESLDPETLLVVDDAHRLDTGSVAALAGRGPHLAIGHRPSTRIDLVSLDEALAVHCTIERVAPLDERELGAFLVDVTGHAVDSDHLSAVFAATGGVPVWAAALADCDTDDLTTRAADVLADAVARELTRTGALVANVARVATLAPQLPDDVLAVVTDASTADVRTAFDDLAAGGLLDPDTSELWPAIQAATRALLTSAQRRELHEKLATAVVERGGEVGDAAEHLLRSGATGAKAADLYTRAGNECRFRDPSAALEWYAEAAIAGELSVDGMVGEIEAEAFAGQPTLSRPAPGGLTPGARSRLIAVRATDEARDGRPGRAAELFETLTQTDLAHPTVSADTARLLATTMRFASRPRPRPRGGADEVERPIDPLDSNADMAYRLAIACQDHAEDPSGSAARFVDAAAALERTEPTFVVPDSPHAIGSLHLAAIGDHTGAALLLSRAERSVAGAPMLTTRHLLLRAWVHLRGGRYELPVAVIRKPPAVHDARDRIVLASLVAGIARRNGDIARLRDAWTTAEPLLLSGTADLFHIEVIGELVLAAARMRQIERAEPTLAALADLAGGPGAGAWAVPYAWLLVQLGVENDDAQTVIDRAADLRAATSNRPYASALADAAEAWSVILTHTDAGEFADQVEHAASSLADRNLPWEASRLAGQAAIRVTDARIARRLLEQARQHHRTADSTEPAAVSDAGLSDRELEIARLVVDGLTHKEVGAQLYISPKTVEHHVANIRRKVSAETRAEMLAILRDLIPSNEGEDEG